MELELPEKIRETSVQGDRRLLLAALSTRTHRDGGARTREDDPRRQDRSRTTSAPVSDIDRPIALISCRYLEPIIRVQFDSPRRGAYKTAGRIQTDRR